MNPALLNQPFFQVALPIMATLIVAMFAVMSNNSRAYDGLSKQLDDLAARLGRIEDRLTAVESRLSAVERKVDALEVKAWR